MARLSAPDTLVETADLQHLMGQREFRRFMLRLSRRASILQTTYGADARHSAYSEGRRSLGLELLDKCEAAVSGALTAILTEPVSNPKEPQRERHDPSREFDDDDGHDG